MSTTVNIGACNCCNNCACCWTFGAYAGCPYPQVTLTPGTPPNVRLDYLNSINCGGSCFAEQQLIVLTTKIKVTAPVTLTINLTGYVENFDAGFDNCSVDVDGVVQAAITSVDGNIPCGMISVSASGSVALTSGCHQITIAGYTGDNLHHVGMYHNIEFILSDPTAVVSTCSSALCNVPQASQQFRMQMLSPDQFSAQTARRAKRPALRNAIGPGAFLTKILAQLGIKSGPACACKARAIEMDCRGCDWCEENIDTIVGWLREEATKRKLPFVDFAGKLLVKRAIKLARAAEAKAEQECDEPDTPPLDSDSQASAG